MARQALDSTVTKRGSTHPQALSGASPPAPYSTYNALKSLIYSALHTMARSVYRGSSSALHVMARSVYRGASMRAYMLFMCLHIRASICGQ